MCSSVTGTNNGAPWGHHDAPFSKNSRTGFLSTPGGQGEDQRAHASWSIRVPWPGGRAARTGGGGVRSSTLTSGGLSTLGSGGLRGTEGLTAETLIGQSSAWLLPSVTGWRRRLYESAAAIATDRGNFRGVVNVGLEDP